MDHMTTSNQEPTKIDWRSISKQHPHLPKFPKALQDAAKLLKITIGTTLYKQGEKPKGVLCVLNGELRLTRRSVDGAEVILQRSTGGFIAEASINSKAYHCNVIVADSGHLIYFPIADFRTALDQDANFNHSWISHQAQQIRQLRTQCERLSLNSAAERILHYIESEGDGEGVTLSQTRKAWASELGLSHEVVYRILRQMSDNKVLAVNGERISLTRT